MKNFAQAQKAAQEAGRLIGGIGQSYGTIGTQAADTGRVYGAMTPADLAFMQGVGESERGFRQTVLDTERQEAQRRTDEMIAHSQASQEKNDSILKKFFTSIKIVNKTFIFKNFFCKIIY